MTKTKNTKDVNITKHRFNWLTDFTHSKIQFESKVTGKRHGYIGPTARCFVINVFGLLMFQLYWKFALYSLFISIISPMFWGTLLDTFSRIIYSSFILFIRFYFCFNRNLRRESFLLNFWVFKFEICHFQREFCRESEKWLRPRVSYDKTIVWRQGLQDARNRQ